MDDENDIDLAVKIFDHFFKKAGICRITVKKLLVQGKGFHLYFMVSMSGSSKPNAFAICDTLTNSFFIDDYHMFDIYINKEFQLERFPKEIKAKAIFTCISSICPLVMTIFGGPLVKFKEYIVIPKARSLEELVIQMELEE